MSITSSNLDEFLYGPCCIPEGSGSCRVQKTDIAGMTAKEQLKAISRQTHDLVHVQYSTLTVSLRHTFDAL